MAPKVALRSPLVYTTARRIGRLDRPYEERAVVLPEPTFTRVAWGPIPARTPRVEALTYIPGMPDEKLIPPEPTFTRAARGPSPSRMPRVEALMRTPGMSRTLKPMGMLFSFSPQLRSKRILRHRGALRLLTRKGLPRGDLFWISTVCGIAAPL